MNEQEYEKIYTSASAIAYELLPTRCTTTIIIMIMSM